jgi:hypothetical protein
MRARSSCLVSSVEDDDLPILAPLKRRRLLWSVCRSAHFTWGMPACV